MAMIRYFAYGSNMFTKRLKARCKPARVLGVAQASGFKLTFSKKSEDGSGKATLSRSERAEDLVYGVLYEIDEVQLAELDRIEGVGNGYEQVANFPVTTQIDSVTQLTSTYIAKPNAVVDSLKPYNWYLDLVLAGAQEHKLPCDYIISLAATPSIIDCNRERKSRKEALGLLRDEGQPRMLFDNTRIAGAKTVADWNAMKKGLDGCKDKTLWEQAFESLFKERLNTRYFNPIKVLDKNGRGEGEGFAIVTIYCSLIEFLASTLEGKNYRNKKPLDEKIEYKDSKQLFVCFLLNQYPFKDMFSKEKNAAEKEAEDFYVSVRCGLFHEARTKGQWRIRIDGCMAIDVEEKIVDRKKLKCAFDTFIHCYGQRLKTDEDLQKAFIRKFDALCKQ